MYKKLLASLFTLFTVTSVLAQTPGSILSQLGARGISDHGGNTNYRAFLVKLDANGKLDSTFMPSDPTNLTGTALNNLYYIDLNGTNIAAAGTPSLPFQTLEYALSHISTNSIIVFGPGTHTRAATAISPTDITQLTLMGFDSDTTRIDGAGSWSIAFENSKAITVNISGIHVDRIDQKNNKNITINAYNRAKLDNATRTYTTTNSYITINSSPDTTVPTVTTYATNAYMHSAGRIGYVPLVAGDWDTTPTNVYQALNALASYPKLNSASQTGSLLYWTGSEWATDLYGESHEVLFGGVSPTFNVLTLAGDVSGTYTNTVLSTNVVDTDNIVDDAVTTNKLAAALRALLATYLNTGTVFTGDVYGVYNSNIVVAIRQIPVPVPASTNDNEVLMYNHAGGSFIFMPYPGEAAISNWALYRAVTNLDGAAFGITNVARIELGGVTRTNWPSTEGGDAWSFYPATQDVDIANHYLFGVSALELGGLLRTNWPASATNWSAYAAQANVDINNKGLDDVQWIRLGGVLRSAWPTADWSAYPATQTVDMADFDLTNVLGIALGGVYRTNWPSDTGLNTNESYTYADDTTQSVHKVTIRNGATDGYILKSDATGQGTWQPTQIIQGGTNTASDLTNTVTFVVAYTNIPAVTATWAEDINQLAQIEIIDRTITSFNWRIRSGAGIVSPTWSINWTAVAPQ